MNTHLRRSLRAGACVVSFALLQLATACSHSAPLPFVPGTSDADPLPPAPVSQTAISSGQPVQRSQPGTPDSRDANVNGVKLHYLITGTGTPIVLLHGFGETSHMWLPLMAELSKHHVVIAPDLRGAGGSDKPPTGYQKKAMGEDIHALVKSLGFKQVKVVGHDIGLMVAYAYAAQHPEEIERIALMDAFLPGVGAWKEVWLNRDMWHFHFFGETPEKLVAGRERTYLDHFWNDFAGDGKHSISESDRRLYTDAYAQPGAMHAGMEWFRAFEQDATDFEAMSKTKLTMPMLALAGEKASGTALIDQARLVATNVQGVVIDGSGHWLMEEATAPTVARLVKFLDADVKRVSAR